MEVMMTSALRFLDIWKLIACTIYIAIPCLTEVSTLFEYHYNVMLHVFSFLLVDCLFWTPTIWQKRKYKTHNIILGG